MKYDVGDIIKITRCYTDHGFNKGEQVQITKVSLYKKGECSKGALPLNINNSIYTEIEYEGSSLQDGDNWAFWPEDIGFNLPKIFKQL